jgi:multisubunit Na+/H+ antiporter MnhF subunit
MLAEAVEVGWVPYLLFESPGWLMFFLALCFAVTRIVGRRTSNPRLIHLSWIAVGLIALLFASSYFVTTKREKLSVALKELLLAVEDKKFDEVRALVSEEAMIAFMGAELTREEMIVRVDAVEFDDIILLNSAALLDTEPNTGTTAFRVNAKGAVNDFPGVNVSKWAIRWRYVDNQWVAIRFECIDMGRDAFFNRKD